MVEKTHASMVTALAGGVGDWSWSSSFDETVSGWRACNEVRAVPRVVPRLDDGCKSEVAGRNLVTDSRGLVMDGAGVKDTDVDRRCERSTGDWEQGTRMLDVSTAMKHLETRPTRHR